MPRYELNVALSLKSPVTGEFVKPRHYCRITIPDNLTEDEARGRAAIIRDALVMGSSADRSSRFEFRLTVWNETGRELTIG